MLTSFALPANENLSDAELSSGRDQAIKIVVDEVRPEVAPTEHERRARLPPIIRHPEMESSAASVGVSERGRHGVNAELALIKDLQGDTVAPLALCRRAASR